LSAASVPSADPDCRCSTFVASYSLAGRDGERRNTTSITVATSAAAIFQWRWRIFR
jgi:hypothetical protein